MYNTRLFVSPPDTCCHNQAHAQCSFSQSDLRCAAATNTTEDQMWMNPLLKIEIQKWIGSCLLDISSKAAVTISRVARGAERVSRQPQGRPFKSKFNKWNPITGVCVCFSPLQWILPSQEGVSRLAVNPLSHTHRYDPSVFRHSPWGEQNSGSSTHSSTSGRREAERRMCVCECVCVTSKSCLVTRGYTRASALASAAGAVDLSVPPGAGAGVWAHVVDTLPYSLTGTGFF